MSDTMTKPETFDAMRFCDSESSRYGLGAPFTLPSGMLCASDTRVLIIFPADWHDGTKDLDGRKPQIDAVMSGWDLVTEWRPFTELPDCAECGNSGEVEEILCDTCHGAGSEECNLGHEHDCDDCDGCGVIRDSVCRNPVSVLSQVKKSILELTPEVTQ